MDWGRRGISPAGSDGVAISMPVGPQRLCDRKGDIGAFEEDGGARETSESVGAKGPVVEDMKDMEVEEPDVNDKEPDEARKPCIPTDPGRPTQRGIDEHEVSHYHFRSWCPYCVKRPRGFSATSRGRSPRGRFGGNWSPNSIP